MSLAREPIDLPSEVFVSVVVQSKRFSVYPSRGHLNEVSCADLERFFKRAERCQIAVRVSCWTETL